MKRRTFIKTSAGATLGAACLGANAWGATPVVSSMAECSELEEINRLHDIQVWRWFYFGEAFRFCTAFEGKIDLIVELVDISDPADLGALLRNDSDHKSAQPSMAKIINRLGDNQRPDAWEEWPTGLELRIRKIPSSLPDLKYLEGEMIIQRNPARVIMVWPFNFQSYDETIDTLKDKVEALPEGSRIKDLGEGEFNPREDLLANSVFYVLDKLVLAKKCRRLSPDDWESLKTDPKGFVYRFIERHPEYVTLPTGLFWFPLNMAVELEGDPEKYTRIVVDDSAWTLKFGEDPEPEGSGFNDWPFGAGAC